MDPASNACWPTETIMSSYRNGTAYPSFAPPLPSPMAPHAGGAASGQGEPAFAPPGFMYGPRPGGIPTAPPRLNALTIVPPPSGLKPADFPIWREMLRLCAVRGYKTMALIAELRSVIPSDPNRVVLVRDLATEAGHLVNTGNRHVHNWVAQVLPAATSAPEPRTPVGPAVKTTSPVRSCQASPSAEKERAAYIRELEQLLGRRDVEIMRLRAKRGDEG
jgi:hypothetical protein